MTPIKRFTDRDVLFSITVKHLAQFFDHFNHLLTNRHLPRPNSLPGTGGIRADQESGLDPNRELSEREHELLFKKVEDLFHVKLARPANNQTNAPSASPRPTPNPKPNHDEANPKSEIRNNAENSKTQISQTKGAPRFAHFPTSAFRVCFGFRYSDFGFTAPDIRISNFLPHFPSTIFHFQRANSTEH